MPVPFRTVNGVVEEVEARYSGEPKTFAALIVEFDELCRFNHLIGRDIDERILRKLYDKTLSVSPEGSLVARIGTYRFVLFLFDDTETIAHRAWTTAEALIDFLKEPLHLDEHLFYITATVGIDTSVRTGIDPYHVLKNAENAMRRIQKEGRNHIVFAENVPDADLKREMALLKALPQSIDNGEFYFLYQPQYDPKRRRFVGAEMLMRWNHPDFGEISPAEFIPLAEKSGMIVPLTVRLLVEAAETFHLLEKQGRNDFSIAVNIASDMMTEKSFLDNIAMLLDAYGLGGKPLTFEIMEDMLTGNTAAFAEMLTRLKTMGVSLALDDYGTGHVSFAYLMHLPVDILKIDRSFVAGIDTDPKRHALFKSMVEMALALDLKIVAEGVERAEEEACLTALAPCIIQGYRYAKPMPRDTLFRTLQQEEA